MKHTKVDTLFDPGYQVNLISEKIVKKLGLKKNLIPNRILLVGFVMMPNLMLQNNVKLGLL